MVDQIMKLCSSIISGSTRKLFCLMVILATLILVLQFWSFLCGTHFSPLSHSLDQDGSETTDVDSVRTVEGKMVIYDNGSVNDGGYSNPSVGDKLNLMNGSESGVHSVNSLSSMAKPSRGEGKMVIYHNGTTNGEGHSVLNVEGLLDLRNESTEIERYVRRMRGVTISLSDMNAMLLKSPSTSASLRRKRMTARDRQLLSARLQIENAPILKNVKDLDASIFRNVSKFERSYDLMERTLKVYVYKEGEKPIFHQPKLRGVYASEGWFMKLIETSKQFTVRDPRKAHLFYLPFSSNTLRATLYRKSHGVKILEDYLSDYIGLIKRRYRFWNRTGGSDHFLVACHDWVSDS